MASQTFTSDGSFTVPSNVNEVTIECRGGQGGAAFDFRRGAGGVVKGTRNVSPGQTLYIRINDDGGAGGPDGGYSGGGSVDVRFGGTTLNDRIAVGAGGGGAGGNNGASGGDGGADVGQDGAEANGSSVSNGHGGTQTSGGNGGLNASSGGFGAGGGGSFAGGGGGGGWYGGGGGSDDAGEGGGGGGGSNYDDGLTTVQTNQRGGSTSREVIISYTSAPAPPLNTSQSVVGDNTIDLSWDENTSAGDPADYDIQVSEDGGSYTQVANVSSSTTTTYSYTALPSTNSHRFRIQANNSAGSSDWSYTDTIYTDPRSLSVDDVRDTEIDLSWTSVRDASEYEVLRAESSGSVVSDYESVGTTTGTSYTDEGLENGEQYYYRVRAVYSGTDSQPTGEDSGTTSLPAPTLDTLDDGTVRELTLAYTLPDNSSDGELVVERSTDGGSTFSDLTTITDLAATSYTDEPLPDGTEYTYRLRRETNHRTAQSESLKATTILPAPTGLSHPNISDTTAEYAWTANHNNGETRVEYREDGASTWQTHSTVAFNVESETVDGLLNGQLYESRVVAQTPDAETEDQ